MLVSVPWRAAQPVADPDAPELSNVDVSLGLIGDSVLADTVALTLFVKNDSLLQDYQLGMDILTDFSHIERLAIDGWWSRINVNKVMLQMVPKLPPSLRYLLIRSVSLGTVDSTMAQIAGMLVDSNVQVFALTLDLPCRSTDRWPAFEYADQLVDALTRMRHLKRLELTLSTCDWIRGAQGFKVFSTRVQAALPPETVTVTRITWPLHWGPDDGCSSTQKFPPFDAFSSELSENLKLVARCTPPDMRFPTPHHFSGAFDYSTCGQIRNVENN